MHNFVNVVMHFFIAKKEAREVRYDDVSIKGEVCVQSMGRVVIPVEIRKRFDIKDGEYLNIEANGHEIIITKKGDRCCFCNSDNSKIKINNFHICESCFEKLSELRDDLSD